MKYLRSTTGKAYTISGQTVPNYKGEMLALSDGDYDTLSKNKVVKSLIDAGAIFVTDKAPTDPTKQAQQLTNKNAQLILENTKLQEKLAAAEAKLANAGTDEESVKAAIAKQKEEDEAAIQSIVSEKDAKIAELEAQLAAASKKSSSKKKADEE